MVNDDQLRLIFYGKGTKEANPTFAKVKLRLKYVNGVLNERSIGFQSVSDHGYLTLDETIKIKKRESRESRSLSSKPFHKWLLIHQISKMRQFKNTYRS